MEKIKITLDDINESLCDVDTEYREALAEALIELKYVSDTPLKLSMGTPEQQMELEKVMTKSLTAKQIKEIIGYIDNKMKGDFQYGAYKRCMSMYRDLANAMQKNKGLER